MNIMRFERFQTMTDGKNIHLIPTIQIVIDDMIYREHNVAVIVHIFIWHFRWLWKEKTIINKEDIR